MRDRVTKTDDGELWQAVVGRDASARARFVYAVVTTGIYCRPGCPSPRPLQANTRFFHDTATAQTAGFRACLRCHPDNVAAAKKSPGTRPGQSDREDARHDPGARGVSQLTSR